MAKRRQDWKGASCECIFVHSSSRWTCFGLKGKDCDPPRLHTCAAQRHSWVRPKANRGRSSQNQLPREIATRLTEQRVDLSPLPLPPSSSCERSSPARERPGNPPGSPRPLPACSAAKKGEHVLFNRDVGALSIRGIVCDWSSCAIE